MGTKYLVLDVNYLAWRSWHLFAKRGKELSFEGIPTGVTFGVFRDVANLMELHRSRDIIFCWDHGKNLRKEICELYKAKRDEGTEEENLARKAVHKEVAFLKYKYLPELGFKNIFYQKGYEADDVIASFCKGLSKKDEAIIVTGDHDLYQCLRNNVSVYHPSTVAKLGVVTKKWFIKTYEVLPREWALVKAIAGCKSDNIPGLKGIGEKTAAKFIAGKLKKDSKAFSEITQFTVTASERFNLNKKLVSLPLPGISKFIPQEEEISRKAWRTLTGKLGMKSIQRKGFGL